MPVRVGMTGNDKVKAALEKKGAALDRGAKIAALGAGADVVVNEADRLAPYRTGTLAGSIHWEESTSGEIEVDVSTGPEAPYDIYQEFGTSRMAAHPYMRPAFENTKQEAADEVGAALWDILEAAV